jgi:hypothetical protein
MPIEHPAGENIFDTIKVYQSPNFDIKTICNEVYEVQGFFGSWWRTVFLFIVFHTEYCDFFT